MMHKKKLSKVMWLILAPDLFSRTRPSLFVPKKQILREKFCCVGCWMIICISRLHSKDFINRGNISKIRLYNDILVFSRKFYLFLVFEMNLRIYVIGYSISVLRNSYSLRNIKFLLDIRRTFAIILQ